MFKPVLETKRTLVLKQIFSLIGCIEFESFRGCDFCFVLMFHVLVLQVALDLTEDEKHYIWDFADEDCRYELTNVIVC